MRHGLKPNSDLIWPNRTRLNREANHVVHELTMIALFEMLIFIIERNALVFGSTNPLVVS
jgi:hypothetical protein